MSELVEALEEVLQRRQVRSDLQEWAKHCGYVPARHHELLLRELEAIASGTNDRLMVFMPPGSAKSTYGSMLFPPWFMAQHPDKMVIAASHTHELAARWGRKCRNLVAEHANVLGIKVADGDGAADRWGLASGGEYFAAGVGGSVTGRRADLVVIDDPVRSREDADSELIRDKTMDWYRSDLWRGQATPDVWIEAWCDLVKRWKPLEWGEEQGQILSGVGPFIRRRAIERSAWTIRRPFASKADKAVRAQAIRGRMAMNGLYLPASAPWRADFVSEMLSFPAGKYDDQVDAMSLVGQLLDHARGFAPQKDEEKKLPDKPSYTIGPNGTIQLQPFDMLKYLENKRRRERIRA